LLIGKGSPLMSRQPQPAWPTPSRLFSLKQALWIDAAAAAPTHAPRRNSGPGGDQ
uniref:Uncharacterized protein n=1 Tax=Cricetulus griseus TaxID=10029 RepID=A0A8C2QMQ6_CRIGR